MVRPGMLVGGALVVIGCAFGAPAIFGAFNEYYSTISEMQSEAGVSDDELESIPERMRSHLPIGAAGAGIALVGSVVFIRSWVRTKRSLLQ